MDGLLAVAVPATKRGNWTVASLVGNRWEDRHLVRAWLDAQRSPTAASTGAVRSHCPGPPAAPGTRVAVALSGGGYRAALTHAGVLAALDEQCVPIHVVTAVSGGSIIGAAYVLGVPPAEFAARLAARKPGLLTAVVDIRAVALDLLWPVHSIADTYSDHFRQAFFGGATLADLPERPILLINVTDLEAGPEQAREVIFPGRSAATAVDGVSLDASTTVADAVAASGAFPGAFRPKYIRWLPADAGVAGTTTARERRFVDGGVVDNFGVEGLRRYLALPGHDGALPARPNLLIISDASGYTGPGSFTPDAVGLLSRSSAFTYEALHRQLYARYAGVLDLLDMVTRLPVREQVGMVTYRSIDERLGTGAPERLATVVLPVTSEAMRFVLARYPECRNDRGEDAWTVPAPRHPGPPLDSRTASW
jgi:predicted acylesterase/phospholipase RssA